jgi:hypothetical protein
MSDYREEMTEIYGNSDEFLFDRQLHLDGESHADWLVRLIRNEIESATRKRDKAAFKKQKSDRRTKFWGAVTLILSLTLSVFAIVDELPVLVATVIGVDR